MPDQIETETKKRNWKEFVAHEFSEFLFNFAFLAFFLVSFAWYRRLMMESYDIQLTDSFAPLIEAAILAKVIMIGEMFHLGARFRNLPLIIPTIYSTVVFSLFVVAFSILEHICTAWLHGKSTSEGLAELTKTGWPGLLAWYVLIIVALMPFFTYKEIERAFGAEKIRGMFFRRSSKSDSAS